MAMQGKGSRGFTLIELMVAIMVVAILVTIGIPSYRSLRQEQLLNAATQAVYTDMMLLKSEAIKRNQPLELKLFNPGQSDWCYCINTGGICTSYADCRNPSAGRIGVDASEFNGIKLDTSYSATGGVATISFTPRRSTFSAGNLKISNGQTVKHVTFADNGRISTCTELTTCRRP